MTPNPPTASASRAPPAAADRRADRDARRASSPRAARRPRAQPGRVGYAPPATPLPTVEVNDVVYLRTATSIEQTLIDVYGTLTRARRPRCRGPGARRPPRRGPHGCRRDHGRADRRGRRRAVRVRQRLVHGPRRSRRSSPHIEGDEERGHPAERRPGPRRAGRRQRPRVDGGGDVPAVRRAAREPELRAELMELGAQDARHAAAVAIIVDRRPRGYVSPALLGEELTSPTRPA